MFSVHTPTEAPTDAVWPWLAEPGRWSTWAPHIRGAVGLGSPEVELGRRGVVIVLPGLLVPARVSAKTDGRYWDWTTGPMTFRHAVEPTEHGSLITLELSGPARLESMVARGYGPLIRRVIHRLATVAERE